MAPPSGGHSDDRKAARVRALLSNYYGVDGEVDGAEPDSLASLQQQPQRQHGRAVQEAHAAHAATDLDGRDFSVDKYLENLLRTARLDKLLDSSTTMSSDIKSLDADMQRLVYENYNRFITATDTIRELKANIDSASPSLTQLQDTSEEIERCREAVKAKLQQRQRQVSDMNEVQALLCKLESVFQLPQRLRLAISAKAYVLAVDCYIGARPVLKRAGYKGTLRRVAAEVETQIKELTALLKEQSLLLSSTQVMAQSANAVECIGLIRRLGGPVADLQDEFLRCMKASMRTPLSAASAALEQSGPGGAEALPAAHAALQQKFFPDLVRNTELFTELFERNARPALVRVCREVVGEYQGIAKKMLDSIALTSARAAAAAVVSSKAEGAAVDGAGSDWGAQHTVSALELIAADLTNLHTLLPELNLLDKSEEIREKCIRHHIDASMLALRDAVWKSLDLAVDEQPVQLQQRAGAALAAGIDSLVTSLKEYAAVVGAWREAFVELLQGSLQRLLVSLVQLFLSASGLDIQDLGLAGIVEPVISFSASTAQQQSGSSGGGAQEEVTAQPARVLFLVSLCLHLRDSTVPHVTGVLETAFLHPRAASSGMWFDAALLTRMLDLAFKHLLGRYLTLHAQTMIDAMRDGLATSGDAEVKAPHAFCGTWAVVLSAAQAELAALQEDAPQRQGLAQGHFGYGSTGSLAHQPDSAFTEVAILSGIVVPALDAMVELLRLQTLRPRGLHQAQLDCHTLRRLLLRHLNSYAATPLLSQLDKVVTTTADRSTDPALVPSNDLDRLALAAEEA